MPKKFGLKNNAIALESTEKNMGLFDSAKKSTDRVIDMEMFSIFDSKTGSYRLPGYAINHLDLIRQLEKMFLDPSQAQNDIVTNSEDFQVFKLGDFDRRSGIITLTPAPEHIVNLHDLKAQIMRRKAAAQPV